MPNLRRPTIAIIGGGPGGLPLARLLQMRGADVTVYERDQSPAARIQGGSLDLHPGTGLKTVRAAGLEKEFAAVCRKNGQRFILMDHQARPALDMPHLRLLNFAPEIDRGDLRDMFLNALEPGTVQWGSHFERCDPIENGRLRLQFANREPLDADLVVGADGARSRARAAVTTVPSFYSGSLAIEGEIANPERDAPELARLVANGTLMSFGDGMAIIAQAKSNGSFLVLVVLRRVQSWAEDAVGSLADRGRALAFFSRLFATWHPMLQNVLQVTSGDFVVRPLYRTPLEQRWQPQPNMTLVGDAAHVMPFYAGEGANMAMADAFDLAAWLERTGTDIAAAIKGYEAAMWQRTTRAARKTWDSEKSFFAPDAPASYVRAFMGPMTPLAPLIPKAVRAVNAMTGLLGI